jgi:hypothetical protein
MSKGMARGLVVLALAFGCGSSNPSAPGGGTGAGGRAGASGPTTGSAGSPGQPGAGGFPEAPPPGGSPVPTGAAGTTGAAGSAVGAAGAAGAGSGGTGGGGACAGDPLTRCAGTMSGPWCSETLSAGGLPFFAGLWANRPDDVWFVGGQFPPGGGSTAFGMLAHFDGCTWTVTQRPDLPQLSGVWGAASNDVWFVGAGSDAYHWNGSALTAVPVPGATTLGSVNGTSGSDVWAVGAGIFHWNGGAWAQSSARAGIDVWAAAPDDVWVASGGADVLHYDGTAWTGTPLTDFGLFSIWGDGMHAYAAGEGEQIFRFAAGSWATLQPRGGSSQGFVDIGGLGADIFTVGNSNVVRLSGATVSPVTDAPLAPYTRVWVSPTQVWLGTPDGFVARRAR